MWTLLSFIAFVALAESDISGEVSDSALCVAAFADGIKHYQSSLGHADYPRHEVGDVVEIARNILLHQRANGGWPCNWDPLRVLSDEERDSIARQRRREDTSFDNRATYPQTEYLAQAYRRTGESAFREGALAGVEFILEAQTECGGWPHSYPSRDDYRPHITFMDDVTPGVLTFLRSLLAHAPRHGFLNKELQDRIAEAVALGDACIARLQLVVDGRRTVWAGQYDRSTLEPVQARSYELPALVSAESVSVVRYLMDIDAPSEEIRAAIEGAVAWFERSSIHGIRVETVAIDPIRYEHHTATTDRRVVEDPTAPPIWARFYEIDTNRPFMANRDGEKVYSLAEVAHERRTGYGWYTYSPARLLKEEYPKWREKWGDRPNTAR